MRSHTVSHALGVGVRGVPPVVAGLVACLLVVFAVALTVGEFARTPSLPSPSYVSDWPAKVVGAAQSAADASMTSAINIARSRTAAHTARPASANVSWPSTSSFPLRRAAKGETTLYRAVSDAELDDIAKNGLRVDPSGRGYQTEKLFTGSAEDAARQAQIAYRLSGQVSTIIEARFPSAVDVLAGRADSMDIFSVAAGDLSRGRVSGVLNSSIPRR